MNDTSLYKFLEDRFVATFLDELMPGIFHNFANPLNGIMGRSKLMQRRLEDTVRKIEELYPGIEEETGTDCRKLVSDINSISNESEKFFDMFRIATWKFYALGAREAERLNLSSLIEAELGFADFYLDYKHNVKKEIHLDMRVPSITGKTAYYSMAIWMLIREAARNAQKKDGETLSISTSYDDKWVIVRISHVGDSLAGWGGENILSSSADAGDNLRVRGKNDEKQIVYALMLFRQAGGNVEETYDPEADVLSIRVLHQE
jgi:signal transduction histidine kinase